VGAVGETAVGRRGCDVLERGVEPLVRVPQPNLPHPGRVEVEAPAGEQEQLAVRGRVPALAVGAELPDRHQLLAGQPVDERRLADARRAERGDRAALHEIGAKRLRSVTGHVRDGVDGDADRNRLDLEHRRFDVRAQVGFRQHDHRRRAALPPEGQVPLQPPDVEVAVQARGQEHGVDVRGDDLLDRLAVIVRRHPRELRPPREDGLDERRVGRRDGDPVADGRQVAALLGGMAKPAGELGRPLAPRGVDGICAPMLDGHARGLETVAGMGSELFFEGWSPAELCKQRKSSCACVNEGSRRPPRTEQPGRVASGS